MEDSHADRVGKTGSKAERERKRDRDKDREREGRERVHKMAISKRIMTTKGED